MADEEQPQQPETSQINEEQQNEQNQGNDQAPASKGKKRKLSSKRSKANKRNAPREEELDAEKIRFLLDPVLETLRGDQNGNEGETMDALIYTLQPSQLEIEIALAKVKQDLRKILGLPNNNFTIYDFGSIKSGLAFRDSDLDFYVHYEKNSESKQEQSKLIHVIYGRMMREKTFHGLVKILGARVPLLRAVHGPTNLTCDINFCNARGCYNSKFIYSVTRYDSRIHNLAVIIKFWAKCSYLLTNHRQMNTYCLMMMLIFYLQTKKLPLLPSVQDLQLGIPRVNYGPWNLSYPKDIGFMPMNKENVRSLLLNFFKYYANFNFEKNLISPYVGRLCTIEEMRKSKVRELQPYYRAVEHQNQTPFNFGTMISIQDPFELNMNIGGVCNSVAHFEQFKLSFKTAYEVCSNAKSETFAKLLENLFTNVKRYPKTSKGSPQGGATINNGVALKDAMQTAHWRFVRFPPLEFELFIVRQILLARNKDNKDVIINERQIRELWADSMLDFIIDILQKIYMCKVTPLENAERAPTVPPGVEKDDLRTFQLSCERQVIWKRAKFQISNEEELENEIAISKARWDLNKPLEFSSRIDMFKTDQAVEFHIQDEQRKSGALRMFMEACFTNQIRKCTKGYFKVMLKKAEENMCTQNTTPMEVTSMKEVEVKAN